MITETKLLCKNRHTQKENINSINFIDISIETTIFKFVEI